MGVKERKAREFKRREEEILTTAYNLLTRMEPVQMTMEMIAEQTEIGRGTIYKHFKSKDEIYAHLILRHRDALTQRFNKIEQTGNSGGVPQLIRAYMDYCLNDPVSFAIHKRCVKQYLKSNLSEELLGSLNIQKDELVRKVEKLLQQRLGDFPLTSPSARYFLYAGWGMLRGAMDSMLEDLFNGKPLNEKTYCLAVEKILLSGISNLV
jgi:AcrR family transcriptional regulator